MVVVVCVWATLPLHCVARRFGSETLSRGEGSLSQATPILYPTLDSLAVPDQLGPKRVLYLVYKILF